MSDGAPTRVVLVLEPGPSTSELLEALERSGMRRVSCEGCGCPMLTRSASNKCPPCRETEPRPRAACRSLNYCNALRAGGFAGPVCVYCDSIEAPVSAWGAHRS